MSEPTTSPTATGATGPGGKPPRTRGGTASRATPTARFTLPLPAFMRRHNLQLWIGAVILGAMVLLLAIGPLFVTDDPNRQDLLNTFAPSSIAHPPGISASATAHTTVSARRWPGSKPVSRCRNCSRGSTGWQSPTPISRRHEARSSTAWSRCRSATIRPDGASEPTAADEGGQHTTELRR